ncbi:MAG: hypothetical protein LIO46_04460 [Clostridiales bacterium]|nr:hypothetical protein [Clostridiales bacterium]
MLCYTDGQVLLRYLPIWKACSFTVPLQVEEIGLDAFCDAEGLIELEFAPGSRLRVFGEMTL